MSDSRRRNQRSSWLGINHVQNKNRFGYGVEMHLILATAVVVQSALTWFPAHVVNASEPTSIYLSTCAAEVTTDCIESLSYSTEGGLFVVTNPGGDPTQVRIGDKQPRVVANFSSPTTTQRVLNISLSNPIATSKWSLSAGVKRTLTTGLVDGTYTLVLHLRTFVPEHFQMVGDPISVTRDDQADGSIKVTIVVKPKPWLTVDGSTYQTCLANNWNCEGNIANMSAIHISTFSFSNSSFASVPGRREMWVAANGLMSSMPSISIADRTISASVAGPHTVPPDYPTAGLVMENGKGLNPAFYKAFVPYAMLEAMLSMTTEDIKRQINLGMVSSTIADGKSRVNQPVKIDVGETGITIDLGLTHFSALNPVIKFSKPKKYSVGKRYNPALLVSVPSGYRISKVIINSSSKSICRVSGPKIVMTKKGACSLTVTTLKGNKRKTITGTVKVS